MRKKIDVYEMTVISCREVKRNSKIFLLELSGGEIKAEPGQFMMFAPLSSRSVMPRPFAVFDIDNRSIYFLIKAVGENTRLITTSRRGDVLKIIGPCGKPLEIDPDIESYILVAGGTGEAALRYPAKTLKNTGKKIKILLGGKDASQIVKEKEFKKCGCVRTITENSGKKSGIVTHLLEEELKNDNGNSAIIACGPKPMLKAVYLLAKKYGNKCQVMLEEMMACGVGSCKSCAVFGKDGNTKHVCIDGPAFNAEWIDWEKFMPDDYHPPLFKSAKQKNPMKTVIEGPDERRFVISSPIMNASGCLSIEAIEKGYVDISHAGALVTKGVTLKRRSGNLTPRVCESHSGILNSIGLENIGIEEFVKTELPRWLKFGKPVIVNISGFTVDDYAEIATWLKKTDIAGIEINVSCPNINLDGTLFGLLPTLTYEVVKKVRTVVPDKVLITKLTPMTALHIQVGIAATKAGSDAISGINTILGMSVDIYTGKVKIANRVGGISGPAIRPLGVRIINDLYNAGIRPLIGMGGIDSGQAAAEYLFAGAKAVAVGTGLFSNPCLITDAYNELKDLIKYHKVNNLQDLVGKVTS